MKSKKLTTDRGFDSQPLVQISDHRFMNYHEAAAYLRVPIGTLRSMVCRKVVPHVRISPRAVTFEVADLDAWIATRKVTPS